MEMNLAFSFNSEEMFDPENNARSDWTQISGEAPGGPEEMQRKKPS